MRRAQVRDVMPTAPDVLHKDVVYVGTVDILIELLDIRSFIRSSAVASAFSGRRRLGGVVTSHTATWLLLQISTVKR